MSLQPLSHSTRSQVFTALFNFLKANVPAPVNPNNNKAIPFVTYSQFLKDWNGYPSGSQPAMFLKRGPQEFIQNKAYGVTKLHFRCSVWVYFRTDNFDVTPSYPDQVTDQFIDGFEQAFQVIPPSRLTLGNTVFHCWIDGMVFSDPGLTDKQAVIVIPISILL